MNEIHNHKTISFCWPFGPRDSGPWYAAQAIPRTDADIGPKDYLWMELVGYSENFLLDSKRGKHGDNR